MHYPLYGGVMGGRAMSERVVSTQTSEVAWML